jgi:uncharacterized protein YndB with AHSA1/START domain
MEIKPIKKSIDINAPREKVWSVLFNDETYRIWSGEFSEGSFAETDWQVGSKVKFMDESKGGMGGEIVANIQNELLTIKYDGVLKDGELVDDEDSKIWAGVTETYILTDVNGTTHLDVEAAMVDYIYDAMNEAWDRAMAKIKELAEK